RLARARRRPARPRARRARAHHGTARRAGRRGNAAARGARAAQKHVRPRAPARLRRPDPPGRLLRAVPPLRRGGRTVPRGRRARRRAARRDAPHARRHADRDRPRAHRRGPARRCRHRARPRAHDPHGRARDGAPAGRAHAEAARGAPVPAGRLRGRRGDDPAGARDLPRAAPARGHRREEPACTACRRLHRMGPARRRGALPRARRMIRSALHGPSRRVLPALVLLAASCAASGDAAGQDLAFPVLGADAPAGTGVVQPCNAPGLVGPARCGAFRVWEDREGRRGRTIDLAFVVLGATDAAARADDAVILLPGGPGQDFTGGAVPISRGFRNLRRTRDILLVDVRGVGRSQALDCAVPYPGGFRSRFGTVFPPAHAAACRDSLGRRANLTLYTTASSVDDLDELRSWLGYPSLNLMGGSYGTRVAQVYMRRHPSAVRTVVLNGVAPIAEPLYVQHARLLQRTLDRLIAECQADQECGRAHPEFAAHVDAVLERFRRGPVEVELEGEHVPFALG